MPQFSTFKEGADEVKGYEGKSRIFNLTMITSDLGIPFDLGFIGFNLVNRFLHFLSRVQSTSGSANEGRPLLILIFLSKMIILSFDAVRLLVFVQFCS
ncbi:hypothetical protein AgCh_016155 [Apium graveolens]